MGSCFGFYSIFDVIDIVALSVKCSLKESFISIQYKHPYELNYAINFSSINSLNFFAKTSQTIEIDAFSSTLKAKF